MWSLVGKKSTQNDHQSLPSSALFLITAGSNLKLKSFRHLVADEVSNMWRIYRTSLRANHSQKKREGWTSMSALSEILT